MSEMHELFQPAVVSAVIETLRGKGFDVMLGNPWDEFGNFKAQLTIRKEDASLVRGYIGVISDGDCGFFTTYFSFKIKDPHGAQFRLPLEEHVPDEMSFYADPYNVAEEFCDWIRRRF